VELAKPAVIAAQSIGEPERSSQCVLPVAALQACARQIAPRRQEQRFVRFINLNTVESKTHLWHEPFRFLAIQTSAREKERYVVFTARA